MSHAFNFGTGALVVLATATTAYWQPQGADVVVPVLGFNLYLRGGGSTGTSNAGTSELQGEASEVRMSSGELYFLSRKRFQKAGLAQGSVLGPAIWNMFYDDLLKSLKAFDEENGNEEAGLSLCYADDLVLLQQWRANSKKDAEAGMAMLQKRMKVFEEWLGKRSMVSAASKMSIMFVYGRKRGAASIIDCDNSKILYGGKPIPLEKQQKYLGVRWQNDWSFQSQIDSVISEVRSRTAAITKLARSSWGPSPDLLLTLGSAYCESLVKYGILSWYPWTRKTNVRQLDIELRKLWRAALGLPSYIKNEILHAESEQWNVEELFALAAATFRASFQGGPETAAKIWWRSKGMKWCKLASSIMPGHIWKMVERMPDKVVKPEAVPGNYRTNESGARNQKQADDLMNKLQTAVWTDASVIRDDDGSFAAGAYIILRKIFGGWKTVKERSFTLGRDHCSYSAEQAVLREVVRDEVIRRGTGRVGAFTDSLSNIQRVTKRRAKNEAESDLMNGAALVGNPKGFDFIFVKGHAGIELNERVDKLADARKDHTEDLPGKYPADESYNSMKAMLKEALIDRREELARSIKDNSSTSASTEWYKKMSPQCCRSYKKRKREDSRLICMARTHSLPIEDRFSNVQVFNCSLCNRTLKREELYDHLFEDCQGLWQTRDALRIGCLAGRSDVSSLLGSDTDIVLDRVIIFLNKMLELAGGPEEEEEDNHSE